jgi:hypothetical protein
MDPVMNWHPATEPSRPRFARFSMDEALRMCEALGVVSMTRSHRRPARRPATS